jgi:type 2 lantibiotic biosynthesis protein LanM
MNHSDFQNSSWYLALGLTERAPFVARGEHMAVSDAARRRLERWKNQRPFTSGDWLGRRLDGEGLDMSALEQTLALPAAELMRRAPRPEWLSQMETVFDRDTPAGAWIQPGDDPATAFLNLAAPMLEAARARLHEAFATFEGRPPLDSERAAGLFLSAMSERVLYAAERALVLELHIAKAEDRLAGDTPEARFASFAQSLAEREHAVSMLAMYPVLARRISELIDDGIAAAREFVERLVSDWAEIRGTLFGGHDPGALVDIDCRAGDPHKRGRSVVITKFASGARLVYKPRSLDVDMHFQELIAFLNERMDAPPFRTMALVARPDYGWMEFIDAKACVSSDEAHRYYWRVGGLLALLHALRGVDCHFENIVAHGDQPVLIDLETIFHPALPHRQSDRFDRRFASGVMTRSVLRVGLLPVPFGGDDPARAIDLSGIAPVEGAMSPGRVLQWENRGTDEMRAVRQHVEMGGAENRVYLDGHALDAVDYREVIEEGFAFVYRVLAREREALLATDGPVTRFAGDTVRVVIRATRAYGMLLSESLHPDLLHDALDRDRFFDRLWVGVDEHPALARVVSAEHRDLSRSDIPYFTTRPCERHVWTSDGQCIENFFARTSLELVEERIRSMGEEDLARQQWMATLSLGSLAAAKDGPGEAVVSVPRVKIETGETLHARCVKEAIRIGDRLAGIAVHEEDCAAWVTLEFREQRWLLEPVSHDLYVGLPGVAMFLAYLADVEKARGLRGADTHEKLARAAVRTITRTLGDSGLTAIGAYSGWGGILYGLTHVAVLWNDAMLRATCESVARRIGEMAERDEDADLVGGLAGAIAALCSAYNAGVSDSALAVAVRAGDLLVSRAGSTKAGIWWSTRLAGDTPATGFSHGNAGIGWALLRLAVASGEERFKHAGLLAIDFERDLLREHHAAHGAGVSEYEKGLIATWCYGAPGIGISRLAAMRSATDPAVRDALRAEILHAVETTLHNGFGRNHCLCHGDLGNLDFLALAHAELPYARDAHAVPLAGRIPETAQRALDSIALHGWLCGTPAHVPSPGLMNGWSGIGYGLLRVAAPDRVPSVLALEPPCAGKH